MKDFFKDKYTIVYLSIIFFLILTIVGMLYFPKPSAEPIVYTASGQQISVNSGEVVEEEAPLEEEVGENVENAPKSTNSKTQTKPTVKAKATPTPGKVTVNDAKININTASKQQLMRLPGVGEATADKIIGYRESHGDFASTMDIMKVSGIGTVKYENMKDLIEI